MCSVNIVLCCITDYIESCNALDKDQLINKHVHALKWECMVMKAFRFTAFTTTTAFVLEVMIGHEKFLQANRP